VGGGDKNERSEVEVEWWSRQEGEMEKYAVFQEQLEVDSDFRRREERLSEERN